MSVPDLSFKEMRLDHFVDEMGEHVYPEFYEGLECDWPDYMESDTEIVGLMYELVRVKSKDLNLFGDINSTNLTNGDSLHSELDFNKNYVIAYSLRRVTYYDLALNYVIEEMPEYSNEHGSIAEDYDEVRKCREAIFEVEPYSTPSHLCLKLLDEATSEDKVPKLASLVILDRR